MKTIPLTQGRVTVVDDCDFDYLMQWKWCVSHYGYAVRTVWRNGVVYMHREILTRAGKAGKFTDHIDQDKLNNVRHNLRPATKSQNMCNRGLQTNNPSGYKGVQWFKRDSKWRARIKKDGKEVHLGYFDTKEEAAHVYNKVALKYHGEFACLNDV